MSARRRRWRRFALFTVGWAGGMWVHRPTTGAGPAPPARPRRRHLAGLQVTRQAGMVFVEPIPDDPRR